MDTNFEEGLVGQYVSGALILCPGNMISPLPQTLQKKIVVKKKKKNKLNPSLFYDY